VELLPLAFQSAPSHCWRLPGLFNLGQLLDLQDLRLLDAPPDFSPPAAKRAVIRFYFFASPSLCIAPFLFPFLSTQEMTG
jgi:hypothetical protein